MDEDIDCKKDSKTDERVINWPTEEEIEDECDRVDPYSHSYYNGFNDAIVWLSSRLQPKPPAP